MINFKSEIAKSISNVIDLNEGEIVKNIEVPKDEKQGDYAFPCFKLAKVLKKSPQIIAEELKNKIKFEDGIIDRFEVVSGYLNFFVNKESLASSVVNEIKLKKDEYGKSCFGKRKKYNC